MPDHRPRVLLLAPYFDRTVPGESWSTFKWVEGISAACDTVVLASHRRDWRAEASPVAARKVVNWPDPPLPGMQGRLAWELKPGYIFFYWRARRWIKRALAAGERFDLVHQINPLALRYPSPARALGLKYLMGPLAGSLPTPAGFGDAARERVWFRKLRGLDAFRLRHDPWLRSTYSGAAAVIGVAPYVRELLNPCPPARFSIMAETGVESIAGAPRQPAPAAQPLRLLFVGRIIRTKGILDGIRAVARVGAQASVHLDVVGVGDLLDTCRQEVASLGLTDRVTFHGRLSRDEVFAWYRKSDVFLFPSFREPSGNVVFEAMSQGLPVITSDVGGPGYVVDDTCGLRVSPLNPERYAGGLADAIVSLASDRRRVGDLSAGALRRMEALALWPRKIEGLMNLYRELLGATDSVPASAPAAMALSTR